MDANGFSFRTTARGTFQALPEQMTESHCGTTTAGRFTYAVTIEASRLDARGFVFDNEAILAYFNTRYANITEPVPSCERIAEHAISDLRAQFPAGYEPDAIEVHVSGDTFTDVVSRWDNPARRRGDSMARRVVTRYTSADCPGRPCDPDCRHERQTYAFDLE